jgi:arsenic resistance protein ArsH
MKFTLMTRDASDYLVDRYSERREALAEIQKRAELDKL